MPKDDHMSPPSYRVIELAIEQILRSANADMSDPNFADTPKRVAKAFVEYWASGYKKNLHDVMTTFPNPGESDLVVVKDIRFYSMCSHHFAPFFGKAAIVYKPNGVVAGLSKFARVVDIYARRFQLQEHMTAQIADALVDALHPEGLLVVLYDVQHMCMSSRGVSKHEAVTTTQAARGQFADNHDLRHEAYRLIGI